MFTGIIEATGEIEKLEASGEDWRLSILSADLDFSDIKQGDSIAVSGVCLTITELSKKLFTADVSRETISCTSLQNLNVGDQVNLEKAMTLSSRLGGHIVSGHVDAIAELISRSSDGRSEHLVFKVPAELSKYIAHKGSVCLDGVSLTVNEVNGLEFGVNIIPHTAMSTIMHLYQPGWKVNLEVDVISRYLERLLQASGSKSESSGITLEFLAKNGFAGSK